MSVAIGTLAVDKSTTLESLDDDANDYETACDNDCCPESRRITLPDDDAMGCMTVGQDRT